MATSANVGGTGNEFGVSPSWDSMTLSGTNPSGIGTTPQASNTVGAFDSALLNGAAEPKGGLAPPQSVVDVENGVNPLTDPKIPGQQNQHGTTAPPNHYLTTNGTGGTQWNPQSGGTTGGINVQWSPYGANVTNTNTFANNSGFTGGGGWGSSSTIPAVQASNLPAPTPQIPQWGTIGNGGLQGWQTQPVSSNAFTPMLPPQSAFTPPPPNPGPIAGLPQGWSWLQNWMSPNEIQALASGASGSNLDMGNVNANVTDTNTFANGNTNTNTNSNAFTNYGGTQVPNSFLNTLTGLKLPNPDDKGQFTGQQVQSAINILEPNYSPDGPLGPQTLAMLAADPTAGTTGLGHSASVSAFESQFSPQQQAYLQSLPAGDQQYYADQLSHLQTQDGNLSGANQTIDAATMAQIAGLIGIDTGNTSLFPSATNTQIEESNLANASNILTGLNQAATMSASGGRIRANAASGGRMKRAPSEREIKAIVEHILKKYTIKRR